MSKFLRIVSYIFLVFMVLFILVPFLMMVLTSFKSMAEINDVVSRNLFKRIFPDRITNLRNYILVINGKSDQLNGISFLVFVKNSLVVTFVSLIPATFLTLTAGYGFAKFDFPLKKALFYLILGMLMVPMQMISIPLYLVVVRIRLIDTYPGIMLPFIISFFGIYMVKEAIEPIPTDYIDAARIDGASEFWIFTRVILPMISNTVVTFIIIKFLWTWNEYFWPLLVVNSEKMKTVTLGLSKFSNALFQRYSELTAAVVLSLIPIFLLFVFTRRLIVQGILMSGLKT